jgi:hypothetical protein
MFVVDRESLGGAAFQSAERPAPGRPVEQPLPRIGGLLVARLAAQQQRETLQGVRDDLTISRGRGQLVRVAGARAVARALVQPSKRQLLARGLAVIGADARQLQRVHHDGRQ